MVQQFKQATMSEKSGKSPMKIGECRAVSNAFLWSPTSRDKWGWDTSGGVASSTNPSKTPKNSTNLLDTGASVLGSDHFAYHASLTVGRVGRVTTINGDELEGKVFAFGPSGEAMLADVMLVKDGIALRQEVVPYVCIERKDMVEISVKDVPKRLSGQESSLNSSAESNAVVPEVDGEDSGTFLVEELLDDVDLDCNFQKVVQSTERLSLDEEVIAVKKEKENPTVRKEKTTEEEIHKKHTQAAAGVSNVCESPGLRKAHPNTFPAGSNKRSQVYHRKPMIPVHYGSFEPKTRMPLTKPKFQPRVPENSPTQPASVPVQETKQNVCADTVTEENAASWSNSSEISSSKADPAINPWTSGADVWHRRLNKGFGFSDHDCYSTGYERSENFLNPDAAEFVPRSSSGSEEENDVSQTSTGMNYPDIHPMFSNSQVMPLNVLHPMYHQIPGGIPIYLPLETSHGAPGFYQHVSHPASPTGGFLVPLVNPMDNYYLALMQHQQAISSGFFRPLAFFANDQSQSPLEMQSQPQSQTETPVSFGQPESDQAAVNLHAVQSGA